MIQNIRRHAPIGKLSWFGSGGTADTLFEPQNIDQLCDFLREYPAHEPLTVLGGMSNVLIHDNGVRGMVIRLGKGFNTVQEKNGDCITLGSAYRDMKCADDSIKWELSGFEFLCGIPGWMGGAVVMNAGANGSCIADILISATAVDRRGVIHHLNKNDFNFSYRHSDIPNDFIITSVKLRGVNGNSQMIANTIEKNRNKRKLDQPVNTRTGGSTFKNPAGHSAWQLIDTAGLRGYKIGDAQISPHHTNFIINHGNATSNDIQSLGAHIIKTVLEKTGILLEWEIKRVGG